MMNKSFLYFIFLLAQIIGCETVVELDVPREPPKIVVNSILADGEFIKVNLSKSNYILEDDVYEFIEGAIVEVYEDGKYLTTLPDSLNGDYVSATIKPAKGKKYSLNVSKADYIDVFAEVEIPPDTVRILSVEMDTIVSDQPYSSESLRFSIEIDDIEGEPNFYEVSVYLGAYYYRYDFEVDPPVVVDSVYYYSPLYIDTNDSSLDYFQSYGTGIVFSDELFSDRTYKMVVKLYSGYNHYKRDGSDQYPPTYYVVMKNTSESYYLYNLTSSSQQINLENPIAQPVSVYNNIENGYGVFSAYNTTTFKVE